MTGLAIEIEDITITFGQTTALHPTRLCVQPKEFLTLLGPSGCGKTTLLRCLAGFIKPDQGRVLFDGRDVSQLETWARGIGFVFQNYALWPHKKIAANVAYGLEMRKEPRDTIARKVKKILDLVELSEVANSYPGELSGGMQQRTALARALIIDPPLLLFDEPLSNLDAKLRVKLRREIRALQQRLGLTVLYVTHDQEEALDISDRIAVMRGGRILQVGSPRQIYQDPTRADVADFVGKASFLRGQAVGAESFKLTEGTKIEVSMVAETTLDNGVALFARPEDIQVVPRGTGTLDGTVVEVSYLGNLTRYGVRVGAQDLLVETREHIECGQTVGLALPTMRLFDCLPLETRKDEQ